MKSLQLTTPNGATATFSPFGMVVWGSVLLSDGNGTPTKERVTRIACADGIARDVIETPAMVTNLFDAACGSVVRPIDTAESPE